MSIAIPVIITIAALWLLTTMFGKDVLNLYLSYQAYREHKKLLKHEAKVKADESRKLDEKLNGFILLYKADYEAIIEAFPLKEHEIKRLEELLNESI